MLRILTASPPPGAMAGAPLRRILMAPMALVFMVFAMTGLGMPVLPVHVHQTLGMSSFVVGTVVGSQFAAALASRLWCGHLCDTRGPRVALRAGLLAGCLSGAVYLLSLPFHASPDVAVGVLLLGRALLGAAESFVITGALAWGIAAAPASQTGRVIAWIGIAMYTAFAIGAPIGVLLYDTIGFSAIGLATLVVPAMALPLLRQAPQRAGPPGAARPSGGMPVLRAVWKPGLGLALSSLGFAAVTTFVALLFASRGWTPGWAGFTAFSAAFVAARLVGSQLPDRFGGARVAACGMLVETAGLALLALAPSATVALLGSALTGLGYSLVFPGLGLEVVRGAPSGHRALALGSYTACLDLALALAGPALGLLADQAGFAAAFGASGAVVLLAAAVALRLAHD
ncbi:arabinose transporter [Ideonella azotifigens]|uniref:MFS transporter n=2 Tax=Ideonella azotifigens TaxID=513160 RepID=A0ABN1JYP7_9BURK|nr:arabinose transporter [Ideonella azotifigens]MCD2341508.1 arabinose transporter [Ideonella azotifigens]